jgi:1-acyl-sn-glycerol-3-phosphate acyltransferase
MASPKEAKLVALRKAARAVDTAERKIVNVRGAIAKAGFPYRAPSIPGGVEMEPVKGTTGIDFDTEWARGPGSKVARRMLVNGPLKLAVRVTAKPEIVGLDRLADLIERGEDAPPLIFVANHHSHLDAALMLTSIPLPWRNKMVVGAAADYFFTTRVTGSISALVLGAFPIERSTVNRRSSDLAADLVADGWSLLVFPEGGRSPDGWGQPFKGGAAYLSERCDTAIVPAYIDGAGAIWGKGAKRLKPGRTKVTFGRPLKIDAGENIRRYGERVERMVAELGDEAITDFWTARQRAAKGTTPLLGGPNITSWRRSWALAEQRAKGKAGQRRRQKRRWPAMD